MLASEVCFSCFRLPTLPRGRAESSQNRTIALCLSVRMKRNSVASRFSFRWKVNDISGGQTGTCMDSRRNTHISSRLAHMLITGDSNRSGMRCRAIIRMLTHMLITTLQLGTGKIKKNASSRAFLSLLEHFIFELELFTQLKSILAGCTFTFVSEAFVVFFCVCVYISSFWLQSLEEVKTRERNKPR